MMRRFTFLMSVFSMLVFMLATATIVSPALATTTIRLDSPSKWYWFGTVKVTRSYFVLGDEEGYLGSTQETDSCHYAWFHDRYDYDYAMSAYAFKAPFDVAIPDVEFSPTSSGYNLLYIACLNPEATVKSLDSEHCSNVPPFTFGTPSGVISVGTRWEVYGDVCINAGGPHGTYHQCLKAGEGEAGKMPPLEISIDRNGVLRIYDPRNDTRIAENEVEMCKSGWFVIVVRSFDSPVRVSLEEPITIRASAVAKVSELLSSGNMDEDTGETSDTQCIPEAEIREKIQEAYKKGYEEAIRMCKANPEKCGITLPEPPIQPEDTYCSYYDFLTNELVVPCFAINDVKYELKFHLVPIQGNVMLQLSDIKEIKTETR